MKKNKMTPSVFGTATFRLVAQCLNQLPHRVPLIHIMHVMDARDVEFKRAADIFKFITALL